MVVVGVIWRWMFNPTNGPQPISCDYRFGTPSTEPGWEAFNGLCQLSGRSRPGYNTVSAWCFSWRACSASLKNITKPQAWMAPALFISFSHHHPGLKAEIAVAHYNDRRFYASLIWFTARLKAVWREHARHRLLNYRSAILNNQIGYGAAIATVLTLVILSVSFLIRKILSDRNEVV